MIQTIWSRRFDPVILDLVINRELFHISQCLTPCKMIWIFWLTVWFLAKLFEHFGLRFLENLIHAIWSRWFDPDNLIQTIWSRQFDPDNFDLDNLIQTIADLAINMEQFHISQVWLLAKWFEYFDLWRDSLQNYLNISI